MEREILRLAEELDTDAGAVRLLEGARIALPPARLHALAEALTQKDGYGRAVQALERELPPAEDGGFGILAVMLRAALRTREMYAARGIPDGIFLGTMRCFPRFLREHLESYGRYGFDRAFWTGRQLSLTLFRLGELEYELLPGEKGVLSLHIPSDADLSEEKTDASLRMQESFFAEYFPAYAGADIYCDSWLLSPALKGLLPEGSRVLAFAARFRLLSADAEAQGYRQWVFKNPSLSPEEFPERTSLQRNMKKFVLAGGKVGSGRGILLKK